MKKIALGMILATLGLSAASAAPVAYNGSLYDIVATNFATQTAARNAANASVFGGQTGTFAAIDSAALSTFLITNLFSQAAFSGASTAVWFDGVSDGTGTVTTLAGGSYGGFNNFASGEPNDGAGAAVLAVTSATGGPFGFSRGQWYDVASAAGATNAYSLVRYSAVPVPASVSMMLAGLGAFAFVARRKSKAKVAAA